MRHFLLRLCCLLALTACEKSQSPKVPFANTDITGLDYAKGFALTDHNGKPRTLADFKGKVVVVFFGYTQCPDVCPTTLSELAGIKKALGSEAERLQVIFITLDPQRDTPELMAGFVPAFDSSFLGLWGEQAVIDKVRTPSVDDRHPRSERDRLYFEAMMRVIDRVNPGYAD